MFEQQTLYRLSCTSDSENLWELTAECFGLHKQTQNSKVQICSQHSLNIFAVTHSHSPLGFFGGGGFSVHILGIEGCVYDHHHDRDSTKIRGKIEI